MTIFQFQFLNLTDEEYEQIPHFCKSLKQIIMSEVSNQITLFKIQIRIN